MLKNNLLDKILYNLRGAIKKLQQNETGDASEKLKNAINIVKNLSIEDLDISESFINAMMKTNDCTEKQEEKERILFQLKDIVFKDIIGGLYTLSVMMFAEHVNNTLNEVNKQDRKETLQ